ncbi:MAG: DMT family transporter [Pseudomonadota bacterium]
MSPLHFLLLVSICLVWAFHVIVIKTSVDIVPPLSYVAMRMPILALMLAPLLRWHKGQMVRILIGGLCFGGLNYAFMFSGLSLTTASVGAVVLESYVVVATILSVLFLNEKVGWKRTLGIASALIGVLIISTGDSDALGSKNLPLGAFLLFLAACCEATGALFVKKVDGVKPLQMLAWFALVGTFVSFIAASLTGADHFGWASSPERGQVLAALFYSVFAASLFGHSAYYYLLQRVPLSLMAPSGLLMTFFAVLMGVILLSDPVTNRLIVGGLMVVTGVGIVLLRSAQPSRKQVIAATSAQSEEAH